MSLQSGEKTAAEARKAAVKDHEKAKEAKDAVAFLKAEHREAEDLFEEFEKSRALEKKKNLAAQICQKLLVHMRNEEEIFYPACRVAGVDDFDVDEGEIEHETAKKLIAEIEAIDPRDELFDVRMHVLKELIEHHVKEEEKHDGIFAQAKKSKLDLEALGEEMKAREDELMRAI